MDCRPVHPQLGLGEVVSSGYLNSVASSGISFSMSSQKICLETPGLTQQITEVGKAARGLRPGLAKRIPLCT